MLYGKILPLASLLALTLSTSLALNASENTFSQAYSDYQAALKQGNDTQVEASAKGPLNWAKLNMRRTVSIWPI